MLGMVAHACSPSTGGTEVEGCNLEDNLSYIVRPCLKKKKKKMPRPGVAHTCHPSYRRQRSEGSCFEASPGRKLAGPHLIQ
jgi:hypothetical protein